MRLFLEGRHRDLIAELRSHMEQAAEEMRFEQAAVLRAEGNRSAEILRADGQAQAIEQVFQAVHRNDPKPELLAYQYLQALPELARGESNTLFVIPSEVTSALRNVSKAFGGNDK